MRILNKYISLIIILGTMFCSTNSYSQLIDISPSNSKIRYNGRFSFNSNEASFSLPSTSIKIKFKGTSLKANFKTNRQAFIYVILDNNADVNDRNIIELSGSNRQYTIIENLENTEHEVEIIKLTEYDSKITFYGFEIAGEEILNLSPRKSLQIEFYGDSNPSGWSAWDVRDMGGARYSGAYFTYPGITSRMLNAEFSNFSAGGHGVSYLVGNKDMKYLFDRIHISEASSDNNRWNFENNYWGFSPDVIVINLGANDYYNGLTKSIMLDSWNEFVNKLRVHNPDSHIVMANSYGWALNEPADYLEEFMSIRKSFGDNNISYVKFPWLWSQYHAVIPEHSGFANILAKHISEVLRIEKPTPNELSSFADYGNLGNPSFESATLNSYPDGWRPVNSSSTPYQTFDPRGAVDGKYYVELKNNSGIHYSNDAKSDEQFKVKVWAKSTEGSQALIRLEFRSQNQKVLLAKEKIFNELDFNWKELELISEIAPESTWQINVIFSSINNSSLKLDKASMELYDGNLSSNNPNLEKISFYPNPVENVLHISSKDVEYCEIIDINGRILLTSDKRDIDLSKLPNGSYFLKVRAKNKEYKTEKIIKK